jgi:6-phosphogluconolactonase (cycloisomerase 2 family)
MDVGSFETLPTNVYVAGNDADAVVSSRRNEATGALSYGLAVKDSEYSDGLDGARAVAMAADYFYVASFDDDAVVVLWRGDGSGYAFYKGMAKDGVGGVDGLNGAQALAVSPDEEHVYVAGYNDDAVAIFSRSVITGGLTYEGVIKDGDSVVGGGTVDGLDGAYAVVVSPDGRHVYVAGYLDDAVAIFDRDESTGLLTYKDVVKDTDVSVNGLDGANSLAFSPDGAYLYVASRSEDAVAVFVRFLNTGALVEIEVERDGADGVDGLNGARAVAVSPDGSQVYVVSQVDDALAVFARDGSSGELLFVGAHKDGQNGVDGLDAASGVAVSPDGGHVYVTGYGDDAVAVFARWRVYLPLVLRD